MVYRKRFNGNDWKKKQLKPILPYTCAVLKGHRFRLENQNQNRLERIIIITLAILLLN